MQTESQANCSWVWGALPPEIATTITGRFIDDNGDNNANAGESITYSVSVVNDGKVRVKNQLRSTDLLLDGLSTCIQYKRLITPRRETYLIWIFRCALTYVKLTRHKGSPTVCLLFVCCRRHEGFAVWVYPTPFLAPQCMLPQL